MQCSKDVTLGTGEREHNYIYCHLYPKQEVQIDFISKWSTFSSHLLWRSAVFLVMVICNLLTSLMEILQMQYSYLS